MKNLTVWKISDKLFTKSEKDIKKLLKQVKEEIINLDIFSNEAISDINKVFDKYLKKD